MVLRQKLNKIISLFSFRDLEKNYFNFLKDNYNPIFLGRARYGIYLSCNISRSSHNTNKKVVLASPYTILDVLNCISASGCVPEFYDIQNENNFFLDLKVLENRLQKKDVLAVLITNYHLNYNEFPKLKKLSKKYKFKIIEDCAIAYNTSYSNNMKVGYYSDFAIFSHSLFKFSNYLWGGFLHVSDKKVFNNLKVLVNNNRRLNFFDYLPMVIKYFKFLIISSRFFYKIFLINLIKLDKKLKLNFIEKKIVNDPYVPFTGLIQENYETQPARSYFKEMVNKIDFVNKNHIHRVEIASIYYKHLKHLLINCGYDTFCRNSGWINFPILLPSEKFASFLESKLILNNIDISRKHYRNCHDVMGYSKIAGKSSILKSIINRIIYLPTHQDVSMVQAKLISEIVLNADKY